MKHVTTYKLFEEEKPKGKGPKGKDLSIFVRFGGLDLKTQKGYSSKEDNKTFHAPPAPRGFYAMPKVLQEFFLIGSLDKTQPHVFPKAPEYPEHKEIKGELSKEDEEKWKKERDAFDWEKHNKNVGKRYTEIRKEFKKTEGTIWHHLVDQVPNNEVLGRKGSWVKTSIKTWQKAFNKESLKNRYGENWDRNDKGEFAGRGETSINKARGITGFYSKDQYEVFFDEKV